MILLSNRSQLSQYLESVDHAVGKAIDASQKTSAFLGVGRGLFHVNAVDYRPQHLRRIFEHVTSEELEATLRRFVAFGQLNLYTNDCL